MGFAHNMPISSDNSPFSTLACVLHCPCSSNSTDAFSGKKCLSEGFFGVGAQLKSKQSLATNGPDATSPQHWPHDAFCELHVGSGGIASRTICFAVIKKWTNAHALKTRRPSQHAMCNECCLFKMARSEMATQAEHKAVCEMSKKHDDVVEDRVVDNRS